MAFENDRRTLLKAGGVAGLLGIGSAGAASEPSAGRQVLDVVLASDLAARDVADDVAAVRTTGFRRAGLGGALYVAAHPSERNLPGIKSRNGRYFRLADEELSAIRPEVLGAMGNGRVIAEGNGANARFEGDDDSEALSAAFRIAMQMAGVVVLGARKYRIARPLPPITRAMAVIGGGSLKTWLLFDPEAEGDALSISETWLGKDPTETGPTATMLAQPAGQTTGVTLAGFTLSGSRGSRKTQNGIMLYERNDNLHVADVEVRHIRGRGFCSGLSRSMPPKSLLRESRIDRLQVRQCGDAASGRPAFEISSDGYRPVDDATNNLMITDLLVIYSSGPGILIENRNAMQDMRYITIAGAYVEGANEALFTVRGSVTNFELSGLECNGMRAPDGAALIFDASERDRVARPPRSITVSGAFGPVTNAIRIKHGKDLRFRITQNSASRASLIVEAGCTGAVRFEGGGDERSWKNRIDPRALAFVTIDPGRRVWSLGELPDAAALVNAMIIVRDIGDGRSAIAHSDGRNWHYTPTQPVPAPPPPRR